MIAWPIRMFFLVAGVAAAAPAASSKQMLLRIPAVTLPAGSAPTTVCVDVRTTRAKLLDAAQRHETDLTLDLDDVEADRSPGVYYEVYIGLPRGAKADMKNVAYVGNIALYGSGIRSETQGGNYQPAHFSFVIDEAIAPALRHPTNQLLLTFVPRGKAVMPVRIGKVSISAQPRIRE